jgi:TATA-binding protein-associated factor
VNDSSITSSIFLRLQDFDIPVTLTTELRGYQRTGISWLAFLNRYKLHGVLCDDMGLGKTIQTVAMLAADHFTWQERLRVGDPR